MARVPITIYKKSCLASVASIFGTVMMISGIYMLFEDLVDGIVCAVIGVLLLVCAPIISERKLFKLWIKDLESKGVIAQLSSSRELCIQMYIANPKKRTIKFISQYNPVVAEEILSGLKNKQQVTAKK